MLFRLKNVEVMYQRMVNKILKHKIGRNIEVYVVDMIVKSWTIELHLTDLTETFEVPKNFNMCHNLTKCASGVNLGKFLRFIMHQRGININPKNVKAILEMCHHLGQ